MKESITKFDLEAAFKALDEIDMPEASKVIANRPALTEIFSRKSKFDALMEEYYDINDMADLDDAKEAREAEVAQAKLARIEKIVDLDAESPEDLLPSYVGKFIMQCPQCMTLFYKDPEDIEASEEDPDTVNVNEICQHCGNDAGYTLIGKVGEATQEEAADFNQEETVDVDSTEDGEEAVDEMADEEAFDLDLDAELDELDLDLEDEEVEEEPEEEKKEESFTSSGGEQTLVEALTEEADLDVSADEFEKLINSPEFKKPMSDTEARAMMDEVEGEDKEEVKESVNINNETLRFAVINPDGTFAGVPCVSEEEARELAAQKEGRIIVELGAVREDIVNFNEAGSDIETEQLTEGGLKDLGKALSKKIGQAGKNMKNKMSAAIDKLTDNVKTREEKADWVLANALVDYNKAKADTAGQLLPDVNNQRFNVFVVVGYTDKYTNGRTITMAPSYDNKDLVIGKNGVQEKDSYESADNIAKGWSMTQGNGPAFIYLAKSKNDPDAVFMCEYFRGELKNDNLEKYFEVVKKHLEGAKLMAKGGMEADNEPEEAVQSEETEQLHDSLDTVMKDVEDIQESTIESFISDSLVESYGNVAGFRLTECAYTDKKFTIDGTIYFTSGNTRKTTYTFTECLNIADGKVELQGLNEKLGLDKQFTITGRTDINKTFITESFKTIKK